MEIVEQCYKLTCKFPSDERFGLTSQIRRAASSLPANIAEGYGRWHSADFARFLAIASGSLCELETHLMIACRLQYLQLGAIDNLLTETNELAAMLFRMRGKIAANLAATKMASQKAKTGKRLNATAL